MPYATNAQEHYDVLHSFQVVASGDDLRKQRTASHEGWEIVALTPGTAPTAGMKIRGKRCHLGPRNLLLYNGLEPHTEIYTDSGTTARDDALVLSPSFLKQALRDEAIDPREVVFESVHAPVVPRIRELFHTIMSLRKSGCAISRFSFDCLTTELISEVLLNARHSHSHKLKSRSESGHFPGSLVKAKKLIAERIKDPSLAVDDIAQAAGLSKFHFIRSFRKHTGLSPCQYLNAMRLDLAKASLQDPSCSITSAALDCGFASLSTFNKAFRRQVAASPRGYRKNKSTPPKS